MNFIDFEYIFLIRIIMALVFGGIIGLERGGNHHEAGLRTHMLLCMGSALVMITSISMAEYYAIPTEVMRMSAQIISGIGFLGAGSIIADGNKIRGITTAAGLWTTACVGLTVGAGYYILAGFTVLLIIFVMVALKPITKRLQADLRHYRFEVEITSRHFLQEFIKNLTEMDAEILDMKIVDAEENSITSEFEVKFGKKILPSALITKITENENIIAFKIVE